MVLYGIVCYNMVSHGIRYSMVKLAFSRAAEQEAEVLAGIGVGGQDGDEEHHHPDVDHHAT